MTCFKVFGLSPAYTCGALATTHRRTRHTGEAPYPTARAGMILRKKQTAQRKKVPHSVKCGGKVQEQTWIRRYRHMVWKQLFKAGSMKRSLPTLVNKQPASVFPIMFLNLVWAHASANLSHLNLEVSTLPGIRSNIAKTMLKQKSPTDPGSALRLQVWVIYGSAAGFMKMSEMARWGELSIKISASCRSHIVWPILITPPADHGPNLSLRKASQWSH